MGFKGICAALSLCGKSTARVALTAVSMCLILAGCDSSAVSAESSQAIDLALQGKMAAARIESAWPISANSIGVLLRNDNELFVVQAFLGTKKTELIVESPEESALTFTLLSLDGSIEVIGDSAGLRRVGGVDDKQLSSGGACRFVALSPAGDKAICSGPEADGVSIIDLSSVSVLECPVRFKGGAWSIAYRWCSNDTFQVLDCDSFELSRFRLQGGQVRPLPPPPPVSLPPDVVSQYSDDGLFPSPGHLIDVLDGRPLYIDRDMLMLGDSVVYSWENGFQDYDTVVVFPYDRIVVVSGGSGTADRSSVSVVDSEGQVLAEGTMPSGAEVVASISPLSGAFSFLAYTSTDVLHYSISEDGKLLSRPVVKLGRE